MIRCSVIIPHNSKKIELDFQTLSIYQRSINEQTNNMTTIKCCFCDTEALYGGNNPAPFRVDPRERSCNECNADFVLPARVRVLNHKGESGYGCVHIKGQYTGILEKVYYYTFGEFTNENEMQLERLKKAEEARRQQMQRSQEERIRQKMLQEERRVRDEEETKQRAADFEMRLAALEVKEAQRKKEETREKAEKARRAEAKREETLKKQEAKQAKFTSKKCSK